MGEKRAPTYADLLRELEEITDRYEATLEAVHATRTDREAIKRSRSLVARAALSRHGEGKP